jgi:hypothetical protein
METITVRRIFESYALDKAGKTAKRFGISVYLANAVWQRWCRHLEREPEARREEVFNLSQVSVEFAMEKFGYTKGEVLRICWHWRKGLAARAEGAELAEAAKSELIATATLLFRLYAPVRSLTGSIYEDVKLYIAWALNVIGEDSWESGRYPGEFTADELSLGKQRSNFRWVYETLSAMNKDHVKMCFPKTGEDFLEACKRTLRQRIQRRRDYNRNPEKQQPRNPGQGQKAVWVTPRKKHFLPQPTASPQTIAKSFSDYSAALRSA